MSNRSWFFASQGKQQGPYPEAQLREFIANGTVRAETLVWSEGMAGWQKAGDIPGLLAGAVGPPPPPVPQLGGLPTTGGTVAGQSLSVDFSIWALLGRVLLFLIGFLLVIPPPWTATSFFSWFIERLRVPQRPDLGFTGKPRSDGSSSTSVRKVVSSRSPLQAVPGPISAGMCCSMSQSSPSSGGHG
jgi:hypothetical protein